MLTRPPTHLTPALSPLRAERERSDTIVQQFENAFKYCFGIAKYLIIPESDHAESFEFEKLGPPFIRFHGERMLSAIWLQD
jgi:hypothetical protein